MFLCGMSTSNYFLAMEPVQSDQVSAEIIMGLLLGLKWKQPHLHEEFQMMNLITYACNFTIFNIWFHLL